MTYVKLVNVVNLTGQNLILHKAGGEILLPCEDDIAYVAPGKEPTGQDFDGIPVIRLGGRQVYGLPDPKPDTIYIVSPSVLALCVGREDVFSPLGETKEVRQLVAAPKAT